MSWQFDCRDKERKPFIVLENALTSVKCRYKYQWLLGFSAFSAFSLLFSTHSSSIIPIPNNMLSMALRLIVTLRVTCYVYNALRLVVNYGNLKVVQPEREDTILRSLITEKSKM